MRLFRSKALYSRERTRVILYIRITYYHSLTSCAPYNNITYYKYIIYKYGVKSKKNSTVSAPAKNHTTSSPTLHATHDRGDEKGVLSDRLYRTWLRVVERAQRFSIANPGHANKTLYIYILFYIGVSELFSTFAVLH